MPWFRFSDDFDFKPSPRVTIAYRAGDEKLVTTACAKQAAEKGRGTRIKKPGRADG